jgi:hypothetical protein
MKDEDDRNLLGCFIAALVLGLWAFGVIAVVYTAFVRIF